MDTDALIDSLIDQALKKSISDSFKPLKSQSVSAAPTAQILMQPPVMTEAGQEGTTGAPDVAQTASRTYPSAGGQRLSRAEREAMEIEQYQSEKETANNDLLLKGLLGAGALAAVGYAARNPIRRGSALAKEYTNTVEKGIGREGVEYFKKRPSAFDPRFWLGTLSDKTLKQEQQGRLKEIYSNPLKTIGAAAYRLGVDAAADGSRSYGWRYNHPLSLLSDGIKNTIDPLNSLGVIDRHGVYFAAAMPALAVGGLAYDITNPSELFRPPGFKQPNPNPENPKESTDPAVDLFQRFALGRSGRPLSYLEAKKDIPDLTPERYGNYLRYTYQDKGPLGLGIIKATGENLQGEPELRMLGYPINIPTLTTAALGALGARVATTSMEKNYRKNMAEEATKIMDVRPTRGGYSYNKGPYANLKDSEPITGTVASKKDLPDLTDIKTLENYVGPKNPMARRKQLIGALGGVALGATAGAFLGQYINNAIASNRNNPETLPTTKEYGIS